MSAQTVSRYLNDISRMLGDVDATYRVEVISGVHDHLVTALGAEPWEESAVRAALDELGPPEEIADAALEDRRSGSGSLASRPILTRSWVPSVAAVLLAVGLVATLLLVSRGFIFVPGPARREFVSIPEPGSYVSLLAVLPLLVPPVPFALAGALLVTISPLYRPMDRVAAWCAVPWCVLPVAFVALILRATDDCARSGSGSCTGIASSTARVAVFAALVVAGAGVLVLLARIARVRAMGPPGTDRWWPATAVALGLLLSALPAVLLPLTFREGTYVSHGVDGLVAYPWTFTDTLVPVLVALPIWVAVSVMLVRSSLWGRAAKLIGVALLPVLLAAAIAVTSGPAVLSPAVLRTGDAVAAGGGLLAVAVVVGLFVGAVRTAPRASRS